MCRDLIGLARGGNKIFETTNTMASLKVGILGMGHVGSEYANMAKGMGVDKLYYFKRTRREDLEEKNELIYLEKDELFSTCDLIFISVAASAGKKFINEDNINSLKNGSIIISIAMEELIDMEALQKRLVAGELKAAFDEPVHDGSLSSLPVDVLYSPNESSAYNTEQTIEDTSNSAIESMINILKNGDDKFIVNTEFRKNI
jgi:phosphoglycerate dehydrogenase-like enzyme